MSLARPVRAAFTAALDTPTLEAAEADVAAARAVLDAVRRRVAAGEDGASSLSTAEFTHHVALRRLDEARDTLAHEPPSKPPPEAA